MNMRRFIILCLLLFASLAAQARSYRAEDITNVQRADRTRYVSNPDGILSPGAVARIDSVCGALRDRAIAQVAVVAVDDIAGGDVFDFAVDLFTQWGVGRAENDNGLGILLVRDRREIRFVTGGGLEGVLPDAVCKRIQLKYMLPAFREGDYSRGMVAGVEAAAQLLEGSELIARPKHHVQDPYSFRCMPQVHGASKDTIDYVESVLTTEINSTTDNPTVFPEEDMVVSAGNFHGQPIALAMDFLAIALAELGNISERRTYKLISGARELPKFLVANPGLNSGFMIPQYTAASIVSQSKGLCMPASVDSIPSSQGQEDHVSMGSNAATKLWRVVCNTERVLAIELFNAAQAIEFRRPAHTSPELERMLADYRKEVPFIDNDEVMYPHIEASVRFLRGL